MVRKEVAIIFILLTQLLFFYNNCSQGDENLGTSNSSYLPASAKYLISGDFEYFNPDPACKKEAENPSLILSVDTDREVADLLVDTCSLSEVKKVEFNSVQMQYHNPYLVYYDGKVFVSSYLHQGIDGSFHYNEYCFNESIQLSFTILYVEKMQADWNEMQKDWIGITIHGPDSPLPGLFYNGGGFVIVDEDGYKVFEAFSKQYSVEFQIPDSHNTQRAIYRSKDGEETELNCFFGSAL